MRSDGKISSRYVMAMTAFGGAHWLAADAPPRIAGTRTVLHTKVLIAQAKSSELLSCFIRFPEPAAHEFLHFPIE
jgi:hypothetical protein